MDKTITRHARHEFSPRTKRDLAGRVGWRCSNPICWRATIGPAAHPQRASCIGVAAHITAAAPGGPRYDQRISEARRRSIVNAIWLCSDCARRIDGDVTRYDAPTLRGWRSDSEGRAEAEQGLPLGPMPLRFASIEMSDRCAWVPHRMERLPRKHEYERVVLGFHLIHGSELKSASRRALWLNPVLDIVLTNDSEAISVVSELGLEAVDVWTKLKGMAPAFEIPLLKAYTLSLKSVSKGDIATLRLPKPVAVPPHGVFRFQLHLDNFTKALKGNQALVRLTATADRVVWRSPEIFFGTY